MRFAVMVAACLGFGSSYGGAAADPIRIVSEGSGPMEKVTRFELAPDAMDYTLPDSKLTGLSQAIQAGQTAAAAQKSLDAGLTIFGDAFGGTGVVTTLAENVGEVASLKGFNQLMTYAGVLVTGVSVYNEWQKGNNDAAAANAYKGLISFAISNYGWAALQTAGTSMFIFDITLREVEAGGRAVYLDRWRPDMQRFFREDPDAQRDLNAWKATIWEIYKQATPDAGQEKAVGENPFEKALMAELDTYVAKATLEKIAFYTDTTRTGSGSSGMSASMLNELREEHKQRLLAMIARDVMPEITVLARERQLRQLVDRLNRDALFSLNREIRLDVTAWGFEGATMRIPSASGVDWMGPLSSGGTISMAFTHFAWLKAGLPQVVYLDTAQGSTVQATLQVEGTQASAISGQPVTPFVTRMELEEENRRCRLEKYGQGNVLIGTQSYELAPLPNQMIDYANLATGQMVAGRFDANTRSWQVASPAMWLYDNQLRLGEPRLANLAIMRNCDVSLLTKDGKLGEARCRFIRKAQKSMGSATHKMLCESYGKVSIAGVFADLGDGFKFHSMNSPVMKHMVETMREGIRKGIPGMDPDALGVMRGAMPDLQTGGN